MTAADQLEFVTGRVRSLLPTALGVLSDFIFLWDTSRVLDLPQKPFPSGFYQMEAAMRLLTPLLTCMILKVWTLDFDNDSDSRGLIFIAEKLTDRTNVDLTQLIRAGLVQAWPHLTLENCLSDLCDCSRFLKKFKSSFYVDRTSFAAHVVEVASSNETKPIELVEVSKVVPKTFHLLEGLQKILGVESMNFDNQYSTMAMTSAVLFNLGDSYPPIGKLFAGRTLPSSEFDKLAAKTLQQIRESRSPNPIRQHRNP
jgi:hypothetical protein